MGPGSTIQSLRSLALAAASVSLPVHAEQVIFKEKEWTVSAPNKINCSKPPVLNVRGPDTLFEEPNRAVFEAIMLGVGPGLARQCEAVPEAVFVNGRKKKLVRLNVVAAGPRPPRK